MKEIKLQLPGGRSMLFDDGGGGNEEKLIVLVWGADHTGKSRLGVTGPDTVGFIPLDRKSRYTVEKTARDHDKKILMPKQDFVREALKGVRAGFDTDAKTDGDIAKLAEVSKQNYRQIVNDIKACAWGLLDMPAVELIEIDLFTQFYEDLKYAHYGRTGHVVRRVGQAGKMYKSTEQADTELIEFVNSLSSKHLVLTHKRKAVYEGDRATGVDTWAGFKDLGHLCNLQVEMKLNPKFKEGSEKESESWHYGLNIVKCLHKPELEGEAGQLVLTDDMITFDTLKDMVLG